MGSLVYLWYEWYMCVYNIYKHCNARSTLIEVSLNIKSNDDWITTKNVWVTANKQQQAAYDYRHAHAQSAAEQQQQILIHARHAHTV